ncbi:hypothetical protein BDK51DRAFT_37514 [Blyttiomyces helicus]|uniref:Sec1-like protein n=1 Tax=Blyttiomyces helicus TaxID=388810 RepID=A0A4P9WTT9_9FUNG|nr:hypothetical protein BDK51DRAFT_37514 [Blyttiomyces helicus]|eukprot:RKO94506.1 hypothetical protein BDK51DRAFT_37514 [Blyttiomyces helicus]
MFLSLAETGEAAPVAQQIGDLLSKVDANTASATAALPTAPVSFSVPDILLLASLAHALSGRENPLSPSDNTRLQDAFRRAVRGEIPNTEVDEWVSDVFARLTAMGAARTGLHQFRTLLAPRTNPPYNPLLRQVATEAASPRVPDHRSASSPALAAMGLGASSSGSPIGGSPTVAAGDAEDWVHVPYAAGLGGVLSGFSRFLGSTSRPHPRQHPATLIFVVGGVTFAEVREIRDAFKDRGVQVLVGSTDISTPQRTLSRILGSVPASPPATAI